MLDTVGDNLSGSWAVLIGRTGTACWLDVQIPDAVVSMWPLQKYQYCFIYCISSNDVLMYGSLRTVSGLNAFCKVSLGNHADTSKVRLACICSTYGVWATVDCALSPVTLSLPD